MTTRGIGAFNKYFADKAGKTTTVKAANAQLREVKDPNKRVPIAQGTVVELIKITNPIDYLARAPTKGSYVSETATMYVPVKVNNKTFLIDVDFLTKPRGEGISLDFKLQTRNLVNGAAEKTLDMLMGLPNEKVVEFTAADKLSQLMIQNVRANKLLDQSPDFKKSILDYLASKKYDSITWLSTVTKSEKQQFAKTLGELIVGLIILSKKTGVITGTNPFVSKTVKKFIVPMREDFPGADSAFELNNGELVPVSSKSGVGAAASVWANILVPAMKSPQIFGGKKSVFKDLYQTAKRINVGPDNFRGNSLKVLYEYGVRDILGFDSKTVPDTYKVYEDFKRTDDYKSYSAPTQKVFKALQTAMRAEQNNLALGKLDSSTTSWFGNKLGQRLQADKNSLDIMKEVLGAKDFYQANLLLNADFFDKGQIRFNMVQSGDANLKVIGSKAGYDEISGAQGTLNYVLSYKNG